jgi:hypothetical protein
MMLCCVLYCNKMFTKNYFKNVLSLLQQQMNKVMWMGLMVMVTMAGA